MSTVDLPGLFKKAEALRGALLQARTISSVEEQLADFMRYSGAKGHGIGRNCEQVWYRARLCRDNKPFMNVTEMLYPPDGSFDYGRAQYRGSKVLYASWNQHTALEEIGATVGDLVQVIDCRIQSPLELVCQVVGELQFFYASGRSQLRAGPAAEMLREESLSNPLEFLASVFVDSFLAEVFRKPVKRNYDYKVSAAYAEWFYKAGGGLIFPSVEHLGAMNLAVPSNVFDDKFEVLGAKVLRIVNYVGYGIFDLETELSSSHFEQDGTINWGISEPYPRVFNQYGGSLVDPNHKGWRKLKNSPSDVPDVNNGPS